MHIKFAGELQIDLSDSSANAEESLSILDDSDEPPLKRRRFERRNSKTAAMLLSSVSTLVSSDFDQLDDRTTQGDRRSLKSRLFNTDEPWDSTLGMAEELVRQLKLHRESMGQRSVP
jgi:hypothetical protein